MDPYGTLKIYLRINGGSYPTKFWKWDICFSNLSHTKNSQTGKGKLTKLLNDLEKGYTICFENVLTSRFQKYLDKRGYVPNSFTPPSMIRVKTNGV